MLSARTRITIGLASLLVTVLCTAMMLGLVPERRSAVLAGRGALCEAIAVSASDYISRGELRRLEAMLQVLIGRNSDIASAGIRRANGQLLAQVGPHQQLWERDDAQRSTETHVQVPIRAGEERWGNVELRFQSVETAGWLGWFMQPWIRLTAFVTAASYLCYLYYLRRMLAHLDPSQAVPKRVRAALDSLAEGLMVVDNQERIVLANQALGGWIGRPPEKLIGLKASTLPWVQDESLCPLEESPWVAAIRLAQPQAGVMLALAQSDQPLKTLQANASPVLGHDGRYRGVLVSFGDVTQLEETKRDLSLAKRAAEEANQAKSEFLARMSHEIRTPMNAILGFTDALRRGFDDNPQERQQYLDTIHVSGEHLLALINDILDLSKIEAGRLQLELDRHSPQQIAAQVLGVLTIKAEEKGIWLRFQCEGLLPETILTDAVRLRQGLMNLVGNAIKFTDRGGVLLVARMVGHKLAFHVVDTGIGISREAQPRVFEPFAQADTSITRRFGGTGLGLAISRQLARALGGDLTVDSEAGQGSTFTLTLDPGPLNGVSMVTAEEDVKAIAVAKPQAAGVVTLKPARVLVADDGPSNRKLLHVVLSRAGLEVVLVENGQQALEQALASSFDVILMDMQMPVLDGYSATTRLRQAGYVDPILALTAHAMQGDEEKCRAAGCSGFLTKPISIDRLLATMAEIVGVNETIGPNVHDDAPVTVPAVCLGAHPVDASTPVAIAPLRSTLPTDDADFREIVEQFASRLVEKLPQMQDALAAENYVQLAADAHWLKGCGGSAGFDEFTKPAATLEQMARQQKRELAGVVLQDLFSLARRIDMPWISQPV